MSDEQRAKQSLLVWGLFIAINILLNGTIPFVLGRDLHAWTASPIKSVLFNLIQYSLVFLVIPLILTKGWDTVRRPAFLLPLTLAILSMTLRTLFRPATAIAVLVLFYLHYRYDLSGVGIRSNGWRRDGFTILLIALIFSLQRFFINEPFSFHFMAAFNAGLDRLFFNPASTTENLFYYGFMTERLAPKFGRWWTPVLIGLMYMVHEMTNPEYWYEGMFFPIIFIGVAIFAMIYLWRRSVVVIWLGDGLGRFLINLF